MEVTISYKALKEKSRLISLRDKNEEIPFEDNSNASLFQLRENRTGRAF